MGTEELKKIISAYIPEGQADRRNFLPLYADRNVMDRIVSFLAEPYRGKVDYVLSPEPLGYILGSMMARELNVGLIALRKGKDHFTNDTELLAASYIDHRNQVQCLAGMKSLLPSGSRILIADDYIETAATIQTCMAILEEAGAEAAGIVSIGACCRPVTREMIDSGMVRCIHTIYAEA